MYKQAIKGQNRFPNILCVGGRLEKLLFLFSYCFIEKNTLLQDFTNMLHHERIQVTTMNRSTTQKVRPFAKFYFC